MIHGTSPRTKSLIKLNTIEVARALIHKNVIIKEVHLNISKTTTVMENLVSSHVNFNLRTEERI